MKELIPILFFGLFIISIDVSAQYKEKNYGNTPDEIVPYANFQNAYKKHFVEPLPFRGAGREKAAPTDLTTVRIGILAPLQDSKDVPKGEQMLNGAILAMEQANERGGYNGIPFELMPHNDVGLWGAAANEVVSMDDEGVWAILGSLNDIVTHVAIRVALKCEIPVVNMADPDPTLTETNIPWVIRVISDDRQSSYALANRIYNVDGHKRASLLRANNRYGRVGTGEFKDASRRIGHPVAIEVRFEDGHTEFTDQLNAIKKSNSDAVVLWGDAKEMGLIINQMREMGMNHPVYTCDRSVSPEFLEVAGANAEGVVSTCQYNPQLENPIYKSFKADYIKRFNMEPDVFATHSFDAMNITVQAIKKGGLNRTIIRDLLTDMKTFQNYLGASGEIVFDASWNDVGQIYMTEIKGSNFVFTPYTFGAEPVTGSLK
jgi:ABC-type branched-subunit amino acid transport system substrate-binding protein